MVPSNTTTPSLKAAPVVLFVAWHNPPPSFETVSFFLNHRRYMRSQRAERIGKSPRELMTGECHPHWLTLLGLGLLQNQRA
jgi:hypothetical protein